MQSFNINEMVCIVTSTLNGYEKAINFAIVEEKIKFLFLPPLPLLLGTFSLYFSDTHHAYDLLTEQLLQSLSYSSMV